MAEHLECCGLCDGCPRPQLRQDLRIRFQRPACLDIARIMSRNQFRPLGANKPTTVFLLLMGRQDPDFACITLLCGHWFDRNEAFVVVWVVDLDCWRLQRDKGKRSTQPRVAAMAKQHGQMTIVEIGDATPCSGFGGDGLCRVS